MSVIVVQRRRRDDGYIVPAGGEIMYKGLQANLPAEWGIDAYIQDMFVMGANTNGASNTAVGAHSHKHTYSSVTGNNSVSHTHTGDTGNFSGSTGRITHVQTANKTVAVANHSHTGNQNTESSAPSPLTHTHTMNDAGYGDSRPPYIGLHWIKTSVDAACPIGGIIMFDNPLANLPTGFVICDGLNGTPDMHDQFVYGAQNDAGVGVPGGSLTHSHTASVQSDGAHTHTLAAGTGWASGNETVASDYGGTAAMANNHSHSGTATLPSDGAHTHSVSNVSSVSNLPTYLSLYFAMRIS